VTARKRNLSAVPLLKMMKMFNAWRHVGKWRYSSTSFNLNTKQGELSAPYPVRFALRERVTAIHWIRAA